MLKTDKFGDTMFAALYDAHARMDLPAFMAFCVDAVKNNSVSSNSKKDGFIRDLQGCRNKDRLVQKMTNFFLAGEGHKVLSLA